MTIKIIVPLTDLYDFDPTGINDDATIIAHAKGIQMTIKIIVPLTDLYDFDPTGINDDATIIAHAKELLITYYFDGDADNWVRNGAVIRNKDEDGPGFDRVEFDLMTCESAF